ncbi:alpha/beta fold hydrolase [Sphingobium sp. CR28]|uniref:alpha/beta fold hydrolase n=1 Tax=Sphingobium sp. CR28 TaxID=3400272 RepID=UPI003FF02B3C
MAAYEDKYWWSHDGLRLHYRDYAGRNDRPPILCLPGLTRNARDFAPVAERLAGEWRILSIELRGRGESAYAKDPMTYVPLVYLQDIDKLLDELALPNFVGFGTSLGGIMLMLLGSTGRERMVGALINDIGPHIDAAGLERIRTNMGGASSYATWVHAARAIAEADAAIYPDYDLEDWLAYAKRRFRLTSQGRIVPDYDQRIAEPFRVPGGEAGVDLWPAFEAMRGMPLALVHGALSDLLSDATVQEMKRRVPDLDVATVPRTGHAPVLDEPEAAAAIDRLLARVSAAGTT